MMARHTSPDKPIPATIEKSSNRDGALTFRAFADLVLQQQALLVRLASGVPPDGLAGLRIGDEQLDQMLLEITNASPETTEKLQTLRADFAPMLQNASEQLADTLTLPYAFSILVANGSLDTASAEVLAILCAIEIDATLQGIASYIQRDVNRRRLTLGTLDTLFPADHPGSLCVGPESPLVRSALVVVEPTGPWSSREISVNGTVIWALQGDMASDPDLPSAAALTSFDVPVDGAPLTLVVGEDRQRRIEAATRATAGTRFLVTPSPTSEPEWSAVVREATIRGVGIIVEADDEIAADARRWIERAEHLPWSVSSRLEQAVRDLPRRPWIEVTADDNLATAEEWAEALGDEPHVHALTATQLELVKVAFKPTGGEVDTAVRRLASGKIDQLTRRVRPQRGWDDIVIPPERLVQLQEIVSRYRHRGTVYDDWGFRSDKSTGIIGLFHGPSGTGKTLAAEIVAGDLGLDLFKLDLSAVVSKYIGETEKNLEEIFEAAAAASGVLLFDEADSLFGKRGEVQDARDRYANMEVSYLLQRVETYDGIVILTTNFQKNIDAAFLRRIHVSIEFQIPEPAERLAIWKSGFPNSAPLADDIDLDFLAQNFKIAGGSIHNVTVYAAFLAAETAGKITMAHVIGSLKREYQKLGRLITANEFGKYLDSDMSI